MGRFFSKRLSGLLPYVPGEQPQDMQYIKLNTNESPFPPSPKVVEAIAGESEKLNLYSDPECKVLNDAIAKALGVGKDMVISGNGSDEILAFCYMAFCDDDTGVCYPDISYGFYPVFKDVFYLDGKAIPLTDDFKVNPDDYIASGRTIFIANPNAPTGISLGLDDIEKIVKGNPDNIVVIDEAYVDFGGETAIPLTYKYENLIVVRTFSKSRNLAGARIGFAIAQKSLIDELNKIKFSFNPYNEDRLAIVAGAAAMDDKEYFEKCIGEIVRVREVTVTELSQMGFEILPSKTNFIFAKKEGFSGEKLYTELKKRGILVRHFKSERIKDFVRITIGTEEQMRTLIREVADILK
ncbi:MAG: histidinol-phosphate transaminase [Ruminococcaceae bacterium]|nr:histidinol-phosphate transaminase [Oscillospiraceae bacterium]